MSIAKESVVHQAAGLGGNAMDSMEHAGANWMKVLVAKIARYIVQGRATVMGHAMKVPKGANVIAHTLVLNVLVASALSATTVELVWLLIGRANVPLDGVVKGATNLLA